MREWLNERPPTYTGLLWALLGLVQVLEHGHGTKGIVQGNYSARCLLFQSGVKLKSKDSRRQQGKLEGEWKAELGGRKTKPKPSRAILPRTIN